MSEFTRDNAVQLLGLLRKEHELFEQMLKLTEKQTELLAADDIEAFDKSLDRRQEIIEKINGLHQESNILMQSYMSYQDTPGKKSVKEIEAASKQLQDTITKCAALNEKNAASIKEKAKTYSEQIDKLSTARKSIGSYIQPLENDPEMFDKTL